MSAGPSEWTTSARCPITTGKQPTLRNWSSRPFKIRTSATTSGYYRASSPVTALPMQPELFLRAGERRDAGGEPWRHVRNGCHLSDCNGESSDVGLSG